MLLVLRQHVITLPLSDVQQEVHNPMDDRLAVEQHEHGTVEDLDIKQAFSVAMQILLLQ